jgi:hypothetical protein
VSSERNGSQQQGIQPRYRRAFGCVTWVYMGILVFLAAAFLLLLPFRYVGDGEIFKLLGGLSFFGLLLILPGMALAALLGARTYRSQRRRATRAGAGIGAIVGWTSFFSLSWLGGAITPVAESGLGESAIARSPVFFAFPPLAALATGLVLYALFSAKGDFERRRRYALAGAGVAVIAGLTVLLAEFDPGSLVGALVATVAAALGGWTSGIGYSRAGGEEMIPPGAVKSPPPS